MKKSDPLRHIEPRWPVAITVFAVLLLLTKLHDRVGIFPDWFRYTAGIMILASLAAVPLTGAKARWRRVERLIILLTFVVIEVEILSGLTRLIQEIVNQSQAIGGLQLLLSSLVLWVTNVFAFSLLYWQIDRGGPEARMNNGRTKPDWLFPQVEIPEDVLPDWQPRFVDYLFLAFTTATAFSPTDALPLTPRAKMLMMLESTISLMTIVVVASRAINILGS
jgi:uncharacterized membrane protein